MTCGAHNAGNASHKNLSSPLQVHMFTVQTPFCLCSTFLVPVTRTLTVHFYMFPPEYNTSVAAERDKKVAGKKPASYVPTLPPSCQYLSPRIFDCNCIRMGDTSVRTRFHWHFTRWNFWVANFKALYVLIKGSWRENGKNEARRRKKVKQVLSSVRKG